VAVAGRRSRSSVGISALVATIILIALTVLGGVLIWAYFQRTAGGLMTATERLDVQAVPHIAGTWKLVDMKITNLHSVSVKIDTVNVIYPDRGGNPVKASVIPQSNPQAGAPITAPNLPVTLNPNQYISVTLRVVVNATTIEIVYTPANQPQQTVLVSIG
jgi:archaellum component FlaF (FlaF/FlaG flagellin family)